MISIARRVSSSGCCRQLLQLQSCATRLPSVRFSTDSSAALVEHPYKLHGYLSKGSFPAADDAIFAVIQFSGTQFKVTTGDVFVADKISDIDIGEAIDIDQVLLVGSRIATIVGRPIVAGAQVKVVVEEHVKDKKVITLKFRRRKNSKSVKGFRRDLTILRVQDIVVGADDASDLGVTAK